MPTVHRVRRTASRAPWAGAVAAAAAVLAAAAQATPAYAAPAAPAGAPAALANIGRAATPAEVRAWDIDVRADFKGLPAGSGSVDAGAKVWEAKCASCHGDFGESNQVFTPIVGGTTKRDIERGRVAALAATPGYPHRTTLMKVSKLSTLWDYINRAMPWNAPKSLTTDEVYAVLAYILNLGDIVPADFTLSDRNIAGVQKRLPNRDGHVFHPAMWETRGQGDVRNPPCMRDCPVGAAIASSIPAGALSANGNIAEQVRPIGAARGTDTSALAARSAGGTRVALAPAAAAGTATGAAGAASVVAGGAPAAAAPMPAAQAADAKALLASQGCTGCHGLANRIVGPGFADVAKKYAGRADAVDHLAGRIRRGGQGVWGAIPMPEQPQLSDADAKTIARWLAAGAQ